MENSKPLRVLCLDGGGMRGTYTATYLGQLAAAFAKRRGVDLLDIGVGFDLITGTSTGGIIACALALGIPMNDVVALYKDHGAKIFSRPVPSGAIGIVPDLIRRKSALSSGDAELRSALTAKFADKTLGQLYKDRGIGLAIPAVELGQHRAWVFKTPHLSATTNHRDDNYTLVNVCLATSAAPLFRSIAAIDVPDLEVKGFNAFVDGGLWANNPVLVGFTDALDLAAPGQEIQIFCLGTCPMPSGEQLAKTELHRGLKEWKFGGNVATLSIDAQQFAFDHIAKKFARHLNRRCSIVRFPCEKVPASLVQYLSLDDTRPEAMDALINQARTDADMTNSRLAYSAQDPEAALIKNLFESMPPMNTSENIA